MVLIAAGVMATIAPVVPAVAATPGGTIAAADATAPFVVAPVARPRTNSQVLQTAIPFTVSWSATDPSGIKAFRMQRQVDGGSWETLAIPTPGSTSVVVGLRAPHEFAFRVRATDGAGNTSAWAAGPTMRVRRVSEASSGLSTTGAWALRTDSRDLGGHALRSGSAGATATFSFTGSEVAWFGARKTNRGRAEVSVDGVVVRTVDLHASTSQYGRIVFRYRWPTAGPHQVTIRVLGTVGHPYVDIDGLVIVDPPAVDPVLVGAGDVSSCTTTGDTRTAALLDGIAGRVFMAGDAAYENGTTAQFHDCYAPTWGRWKARTSPAIGNHEYHTRGAAPYFAYFGSRAGTAGTGWYAYDLGTWRIYTLNANCSMVGCGPTSAQVAWLRDDLAAHPRACVAAVWHQPRWSSGAHGNNPDAATLWTTLVDARADVVLNGHDHDYERFAPQDAAGAADALGVREFVVGTGGAGHRPFGAAKANSVVRNASASGVLKLTLHPGSYDWRFVPVAGQTFTDSGSAACH